MSNTTSFSPFTPTLLSTFVPTPSPTPEPTSLLPIASIALSSIGLFALAIVVAVGIFVFLKCRGEKAEIQFDPKTGQVTVKDDGPEDPGTTQKQITINSNVQQNPAASPQQVSSPPAVVAAHAASNTFITINRASTPLVTTTAPLAQPSQSSSSEPSHDPGPSAEKKSESENH